MFHTFQLAVRDFWQAWCDLFAPIPYGDPYLAGGALFVILVVGCKLAAGRRPEGA